MDYSIAHLLANFLLLAAFVIHTFMGDREIGVLQPARTTDHNIIEKWTMARCGWHWVSVDLLPPSAM